MAVGITDAAVWASASDYLLAAWVWRWFCIFAVGSGIVLLARALWPQMRARSMQRLRRGCALGALALIVSCAGLALDTFRLERQDPQAIVLVRCEPLATPAWLDSLGVVRCQGHWPLHTTQPLAVPRGAALCLAVLPGSRHVLATRACEASLPASAD